jgi:hypothetical protein
VDILCPRLSATPRRTTARFTGRLQAELLGTDGYIVGTRKHSAAGLLAILLAAFFSMGVSACVQTESQRRADLRERAEELIPDGATIVSIGYGDCVELAPSPSCAGVVFEMDEPDSGRRAALVREEAQRHGWTIKQSDEAQGGWSVFAGRDGYTAMAILWRPEVYDVDCTGHLDPAIEDDKFCFNTLNIQR